MELRDTDAQYTEDLDKLCDFSGPNAIDACLEGGKLPSVTPASWRLLTRPFVIVASWFFGIEVLRREQLKRKHEPLEGRGRGRSRGTGKGRGRGRAKLERALSKEEEDEIIPPSQKDFVPAKAKARVRAPKPKPNQTEPTTAAKARAAKAKAKAKAKGKPSGSKSKAAGPTTPEKSKRTKKVKVRMTIPDTCEIICPPCTPKAGTPKVEVDCNPWCVQRAHPPEAEATAKLSRGLLT